MADTIFQGFQYALVQGLLASAPDVRLKLVMSSFTGASEEDAINLDDITTIDEFDGIGYQEIDCASVTFAYDSTANEYQLDFEDDEFNASGGTSTPGSDDAIGMLLYLYVDGTEANDIALAYTTSGGFPFNASNNAIALTVNSSGFAYLKAA